MSSWETIRFSDSTPQLLVKSHFDNFGYEVHITDLSRVWGERLDRAAIIERANSVDCSIEPSEDDQYRILLDKIKLSLQNEDGTSLSLRASSDGRCLEAIISAPLPSPLPTFQWTLNLFRVIDTRVGSELVIPLLHQASQLQHQIELLVEELHAKDRVISKITDRLETSGNDLTTVFPGVSNIRISRKRSQRLQLAKYIKGLADFDLNSWNTQITQNQPNSELSRNNIDKIFERVPQPQASDVVSERDDQWWKNISNAPAPEVSSLISIQPDASAKSSDALPRTEVHTEKARSESPEAEFQRQSTPPHLKRRAQGHHQDERHNQTSAERDHNLQADDETTDGASTDNERDLDAPAESTVLSQPEADPASRSKISHKLGTVGGSVTKNIKNAPTARKQADQSSSTRRTGRLGTFGGRAGLHPSGSNTEGRARETNECKPRSKLGKLGGKKSASITAAPTPYSEREAPGPDVVTKAYRPGSSGEKRPSPPDVPNALEGHGQSHPPIKTEEQTNESEEQGSQERADQKRSQLKRQLLEQSKMPVKQKRRF